MKDSNNRSIAFAVIMIIFGFILVLHPSHTLTVLARTIGWAVLLSGGVSVLSTIIGENNPLAAGSGAAALIVGFYLVMFPSAVVSVIPILVGIVIIISGCTNFTLAWQGRHAPNYSPTRDLILAALTVLAGGVIVLNPFRTAGMVVVFIGAVLIANGVLNLIAALKRRV